MNDELGRPTQTPQPMTSSGMDPTAFAQMWRELAEAIGAAPSAIFLDDVPDDPQLRAEGYRYLTRLLRAGIAICIEHDDPLHPDFTRMYEPYNSYGIDNPDYHYLFATIDGEGTYKISGTMGNADFIDVMVQGGHFSLNPGNETISSLDSRRVDVGHDGAVEITVSPTEQPGAWLRSNERARFVQIRECFTDWTQPQEAMQVRIERLGAAYPPRVDLDAQLRSLSRLRDWMSIGLRGWDRHMRALCMDRPPNHLTWHGTADTGGGKTGQHYGFGSFDIADGTALVLEWQPPQDASYWMFGTGSWFWESYDPWRRQVSVNHRAARLDRDGRFRAVVAGTDPGVPNWLDTAGNRRGILVARCIDSASAPAADFTLVPLADLRRHLPLDTPVVTPEQRAEALRLRHAAGRSRMRV